MAAGASQPHPEFARGTTVPRGHPLRARVPLPGGEEPGCVAGGPAPWRGGTPWRARRRLPLQRRGGGPHFHRLETTARSWALPQV